MPNISKEMLSFLQKASLDSKSEAVVFNNHGQLEPLCAIYSAKGLQRIMQQYLTNNLSRHSMHFVLNQLLTTMLEVPDTWQHYFVNINSKNDLDSL
jgi:molybdopterin-guanine dinucleotide biosynthesis protein A